jgi:hypothetical protein
MDKYSWQSGWPLLLYVSSHPRFREKLIASRPVFRLVRHYMSFSVNLPRDIAWFHLNWFTSAKKLRHQIIEYWGILSSDYSSTLLWASDSKGVHIIAQYKLQPRSLHHAGLCNIPSYNISLHCRWFLRFATSRTSKMPTASTVTGKLIILQSIPRFCPYLFGWELIPESTVSKIQ